MKISILTNEFPPKAGGISRYIYELARNWIKLGADITIVSSILPDDGPGFFDASIRDHIFLVEKKGTRIQRRFLEYVVFMKIVFKKRPDFIFFPVWYPYSLFMVLFSYLIRKKFPYIIGCHGADVLAIKANSSMPVNRLFKFLGAKALHRARALFAVSRFTANELEKTGVKAEKIQRFPNGVDLDMFKPIQVNKSKLLTKYEIPFSGQKILLTVARLNPRKGFDTVLRTIHALKEEGILLTYLIVGSGEQEYHERLNNLINSLGLSEQVYILTSVQDNELVQFYNICDVFLLLSRQENDMNVEGFGIVFLEANACCKPVIAGKSGGIPDAVENGKNGFLIDPLSVDEAKEKLLFLLNNPQKAIEMGEYGLRRVEEQYTWSKIAEDMIAYLRTLT